MTDRRETILAALFTALQTLNTGLDTTDIPFVAIERNPAADLPETSRPALRMFDGDEVAADRAPRPAKRKAPQACRMQPAIWLYMRNDKEAIGADMNALIARARKVIFGNPAFLAALGEEDVIVQDTLTFGLNQGKKVESDVGITLSIDYSFNPENP